MELLRAASILFVLLNPFLMSIYLIDLIKCLTFKEFMKVMLRAHYISGVAFMIFAIAGESVFESVFNVRFASFLIFGGIIFLLIGVNAIFTGKGVMVDTRGGAEHLAGSVAMPFMIAPGTLSASVLIGSTQQTGMAMMAIALALMASFASIVVFKLVHDPLKSRNERLLNRYVEVVGRVVALFTGTYAIEMIVRGVEILLK
ncbi:MAG: MarC family protein [Pseudomonadales bacterium]|nr:MarC family protein [Pseudomonadales bacterium]